MPAVGLGVVEDAAAAIEGALGIVAPFAVAGILGDMGAFTGSDSRVLSPLPDRGGGR